MNEIKYLGWVTELRAIYAERGYITNADIKDVTGGADVSNFKRVCRDNGITHPPTITKYEASLIQGAEALMVAYRESKKPTMEMSEVKRILGLKSSTSASRNLKKMVLRGLVTPPIKWAKSEPKLINISRAEALPEPPPQKPGVFRILHPVYGLEVKRVKGSRWLQLM